MKTADSKFIELVADATFLSPPSPRLSATLLSVRCESYSNAKKHTLDCFILSCQLWNHGHHNWTEIGRGGEPKLFIMLTCPCNEDPFTPYFYIVKLGFTGVYITFLFLLLNIDCRYSLEPPH